jgi:hypothetical protein
MPNLDGTDEYFDSRDVIARIDELIALWEEATGDTFADYVLSTDDYRVGLSEDEAVELAALLDFLDYAESSPDWEYGLTFIADFYFEDYAQELAEDIGAIDRTSEWPANHIDWEAAADALKPDYAEFVFRGETYWARA